MTGRRYCCEEGRQAWLKWVADCGLCTGRAEDSILGLNFGDVGFSLASPEEIVGQLKAQGITKVRLPGADPSVLKALRNSIIEVMVGIQNDKLSDIGMTYASALAWVQSNVLPYLSKTNITIIAVGNETLTRDKKVSEFLVQAMRNIHQALVETEVASRIKVSSPHSISVLSCSFPPSWGSFSSGMMQEVLLFLSETQAPFMINIDPYQAYKSVTRELGLDYHLLIPSEEYIDPNSGLNYDNAFNGMLDAVFSAMASLNYSELSMIVTETGWPSQGKPDQVDASAENAATYHSNLVDLIHSTRGTPLRPNTQFQVYVNDLSYATLKPGAMIEEQRKTQQLALNRRSLSERTTGSRKDSTIGYVWCVAISTADVYVLQNSLNWTCSANGGGVNCNPTYPGGVCFLPNTIQKHSSWAFNMYFHANLGAPSSCNFSGTAMETYTDPGE